MKKNIGIEKKKLKEKEEKRKAKEMKGLKGD